ncbi:MAG: BACON domain-containing protein [Tannerellaceae bacterium]|nr:BACON domain-containing protein [Tannerellaceae bacterium]
MVTVTASAGWTVEEIPDWVVVSPAGGIESPQIVYLQVEKNLDTTTRYATLTFTCGSRSVTLDITQLGLDGSKPYLKIEATPGIGVSVEGGTLHAKVITNQPWKIVEIPDWISVSQLAGDGPADIVINVAAHRQKSGRGASLVFRTEELMETLVINQYRLGDILRTPLLPFSQYNEMGFNSNRDWYEMKLYSLFVNSGIGEKVYIGNLLGRHAGAYPDITAFTGYTFNPVTVSTSAAVSNVAKTYIPSPEGQQEMVQYILSQNPQQSISFESDNGTTEFYDYKQLYAIGMVNMGIGLDELVSGSPFTEKEMSRNFGMIYIYKHTAFDLVMDIPRELPLINEPVKETDKARSISYVSRVTFGTLGLLVVELDTDSRQLRVAVDKVIQNQALSEEEAAWIAEAGFSYIYFNHKKEVQVLQGNMEAIEAYKQGMADWQANIHPLAFGLADVASHTRNEIDFTIQMP